MSFRCDYVCKKCGARSDDVPTTTKDQWCPYCGVQMNRIYTPPLVVFNGDGWTPKFGDKKEK
jgi:predicted nucleic acid-binding Zn ribbon protein